MNSPRLRKRLLSLVLLCAGLVFPPAITGEDPPTDEILFRVNDLSINRSAIELEFMAELGPELKRLGAGELSAAEREILLQKTWNNAVDTVVNGAMVCSQSRDEWEQVQQFAKAFPQGIREITDRYIREQLESRSGGAAEFDEQLKRFGVGRENLRAMLLERAAVQMYLDSKFRHVSQSTPDSQRTYYKEHPLEFAASGAVRLQRLALKTAHFQALPPAEYQAYLKDLCTTWQEAKDPDAVATGLAARSAFEGKWTALKPAVGSTPGETVAEAEKKDWIAFDQLPDELKDAASLLPGRVLPPVPVERLRKAQAFHADGPATLREASADLGLLLLFRIADQRVTPKPFEEVRAGIRDRLNHKLLTQAKDEFYAQLRKNTLVTAPSGNPPPISARFLKLDLSSKTPVPVPDP